MSHNNEETILDSEARQENKTTPNSAVAEKHSNYTSKQVMFGSVAAMAVGAAAAVGANALVDISTASDSHHEDSPIHNHEDNSQFSNDNVVEELQDYSESHEHLGFAESFDASPKADAIIEPHYTPASDSHNAIILDVVTGEDVLPSGEHFAMGEVEGHQAFVIDIDPELHDGGDVAIIDLNNDFSPDANEVFNVHTGEQLDDSTGYQVLAAIHDALTSSSSDSALVPTVDTHDVAHHITDIAPDMPDYINDADVNFA